MNRFAIILGALVALGLGTPALAQGSRPVKEAPKKKAPKSKKVTLTKDGSLKLAHAFSIALEKGDVKKALTMVKVPFLLVTDGKLKKVSAKELEVLLKGKFGKRIGERVAGFRKKDAGKMTALYWGPKSARGKATAKTFKELKGAGWVGMVYAGKKKKAEQAKKPLAIGLVGKELKITGFHDD